MNEPRSTRAVPRPRAPALRQRGFLLAALLLASCRDAAEPTGPGRAPPLAHVAASPAAADSLRDLATFGTLVAVDGSVLVLRQEGLDFRPGHARAGMDSAAATHRLSVGHRGKHLRVDTDTSTQVLVGNARVPLGSLREGMQLMVFGRAQGGGVRATRVTDLSITRSPPPGMPAIVRDESDLSARAAVPAMAAPRTTSMCLGKVLGYAGDAAVRDFQGCYGGPSASATFPLGIPFGFALVGVFTVDWVGYHLALGGWGYGFPVRFSARPRGDLVYHVPGVVELDVEPLPPAHPLAFTFTGGLGFAVSFGVSFCGIWGECHDVGTVTLSELSMIHTAAGALPLTGQTLEIEEFVCPGVGVVGAMGFDLLSVELCENLSLHGAPFRAAVRAEGASPGAGGSFGFAGPPQALAVRPDGLSLNVVYDGFAWTGDMEVGLNFHLTAIGGGRLWTSPDIPMGTDAFHAVSTPFPLPGSLFTVATDPLSSPGDPRYLFQPASWSTPLRVDPAPTRLSIVSAPTLAEGTPVRAVLVEAYDGSPIAGQTVTFQGVGPGGTVTASGVTDAAGVARAVLGNGEYTVTARFAGIPVYLPSSDVQGPVYVYRPTSFVVWGGNPGGLRVGQAYQFWGNQWWRQVAGGGFGADASFLGWATRVAGGSWNSPPGNSVRPVPTVPAYIGVISTTRMRLHGTRTMGNVAGHVVLRVANPAAFRPVPGHRAWGTMKAAVVTAP